MLTLWGLVWQATHAIEQGIDIGTAEVCAVHPETGLICPRCNGRKGGTATARKYPDRMADWGAMGGRPRKQLQRASAS